MTNPLISIIVPIYNTQDFLFECLESIKRQTYINFEVLLINDGSTDNSAEICKSFCSKDSRFKLYTKENGGLSSARNFGIEKSQGDYITFVDSDDLISPYFLEILYENLQEGCSIAQCSYSRFSDINQIRLDIDVRKSLKFQIITETLDNYIRGLSLSTMVWDKIYKREIFQESEGNLRFPKGMTMEDAYILTDIYSLHEIKIAVTNYPLYFYRERENSIITQKKYTPQFMECSFKQYEHRIEKVKEYKPELLKLTYRQLASDFLQYYRLIYLGRVKDKDGSNVLSYQILKSWNSKYYKYIPYGKLKLYLLILKYFPSTIKFLIHE